MCGRMVMSSTPSDFVDYFNSVETVRNIKIDSVFKESFIPRFNISPGSKVFAISQTQSNKVLNLDTYKWGLVPHWAKDDSFSNKCFNARAETISEKPTFKDAFKRSRCIILADGYYEWKVISAGSSNIVKQPYFIHDNTLKPLFFAGLFEPTTNSATIVTTESINKLSDIHHRRPVFLSVAESMKWLNHNSIEKELLGLIENSKDTNIDAYQVSTLVNKSTVDGEALIEKLDSLF